MKHKAIITFIIETNDEKYWEEILGIKMAINSGELQRSMKYSCRRDIENPAVHPKAKVKAIFKEE